MQWIRRIVQVTYEVKASDKLVCERLDHVSYRIINQILFIMYPRDDRSLSNGTCCIDKTIYK